MAFREQAKGLLDKFIAETADLGMIEKDILLEGRIMSVLIAPKADKVPGSEKPAA
jgi:translation initiation factor IF-3